MRVMLVDDSKTIRRIQRSILEQIGYTEIEEACDGQDALSRVSAFQPNLILLDWNMPNMNGLEFLRALRREAGGEKPVVVFCTTENDINHITEAMTAGANEYIMKPFDREIIEAKFSEAGLV